MKFVMKNKMWEFENIYDFFYSVDKGKMGFSIVLHDSLHKSDFIFCFTELILNKISFDSEDIEEQDFPFFCQTIRLETINSDQCNKILRRFNYEFAIPKLQEDYVTFYAEGNITIDIIAQQFSYKRNRVVR